MSLRNVVFAPGARNALLERFGVLDELDQLENWLGQENLVGRLPIEGVPAIQEFDKFYDELGCTLTFCCVLLPFPDVFSLIEEDEILVFDVCAAKREGQLKFDAAYVRELIDLFESAKCFT